jgi:hypothetical protein
MTALWFLFAASCRSGADDTNSPEAVAARVTAVMLAEDYDELLPLILPRDRDLVTAALFLAAGFAADKDELVALKKKHGLDTGRKLRMQESRDAMRASASEWLGDTDRNALFADLLVLLARHGGARIPSGELSELKVEGDQASGTLGGKPVRFIRAEGRWYITIPAE